ncbi:hypothetical protein MTO96_016734 [Rhipicephalus appendiculatus]
MQRPARPRSADFELHFGHRGSGRAPRSAMLITSSGGERRSINNVSDVRPSSRRLREYTAFLVGSRPSLCLSVCHLLPNLLYHLSILSHRQVYHDTSGMSSAVNGCFVLAELSL